MERRKRRKFTTEFRAEAVRLVREGTKSLPQVAKDLDLTESALRIWVRRAEVAEGKGPAGALSAGEREELVQLRRENRQLQMERELLKKWAAFFAKESSK
jgi:transposase